ncbi:NIPSNAP family protein [Phenylobacterium sp.]|uniref:NIPSNAP family protein n=1 Tax=Phenylobacterium sp. TaxID=1871053 RepID=UPI002DEE11C6|nr:NIPSNAP family protein [Phenylobacterium sp.]
MIVEMRTYTLALGATGRYFKTYGEKGLAVQKRILGHLVGYYAVEVGGLNKVIHMWAYDSFEARTERRAALWADEEWLAYVREIGPLVTKQENEILTPAPFFKVPPPA